MEQSQAAINAQTTQDDYNVAWTSTFSSMSVSIRFRGPAYVEHSKRNLLVRLLPNSNATFNDLLIQGQVVLGNPDDWEIEALRHKKPVDRPRLSLNTPVKMLFAYYKKRTSILCVYILRKTIVPNAPFIPGQNDLASASDNSIGLVGSSVDQDSAVENQDTTAARTGSERQEQGYGPIPSRRVTGYFYSEKEKEKEDKRLGQLNHLQTSNLRSLEDEGAATPAPAPFPWSTTASVIRHANTLHNSHGVQAAPNMCLLPAMSYGYPEQMGNMPSMFTPGELGQSVVVSPMHPNTPPLIYPPTSSLQPQCQQFPFQFTESQYYGRPETPISIRSNAMLYAMRPNFEKQRKNLEAMIRQIQEIAHFDSFQNQNSETWMPRAATPIDRPSKCHLCGRGYLTPYGLKLHRETVHRYTYFEWEEPASKEDS